MLNCTKKLACLGAAGFAALTLSGCSGKFPFGGNSLDFDKSYVVSADITCGELEAKADVTRVSENEWSFLFTEPKELNGIMLKFGERGYSASLGGLSFEADENAGYIMVPEIISGSINSLVNRAGEDLDEKDGVVTVDTEFGGKKVTVTANSKTGELITLKCPYHKLSVAFSGQKAYVPQTESELPEEGGLIIRDSLG